MSSGAPLGAEGKHGLTVWDVGQAPWHHWDASWPCAPTFGERGGEGCCGLVGFWGA